ncbi:MAG: hypothetical protein JWQ64_1783 [Subtercola sp.]|nr:hypothetical protein [Subtercola sp.]
MNTPTVSSSLRRTFVGRAVLIAWDALPLMVPAVFLIPMAVFGSLLLAQSSPLLAAVGAGSVCSSSSALALFAALRSAHRLGETAVAARLGWATFGRALAGAAVPTGALLTMALAGSVAAVGAPSSISIPAWCASAALLLLAILCFPYFLVSIVQGDSLGSAVRSVLYTAASRPAQTGLAATVTGATTVAAVVGGPIALAAAIPFAFALYVLIIRSNLTENPLTHA